MRQKMNILVLILIGSILCSAIQAQDFSSVCKLQAVDGRIINFGNVSRPTSYRVPSIDKPDIIYFINVCRYATCNATDSAHGCFGCSNVNTLNTFAIRYNKTSQSCTAFAGSDYPRDFSFKFNVNATAVRLPVGQTDVRNGIQLTYNFSDPSVGIDTMLNVKIYCDTANIPWFLPSDVYQMSNSLPPILPMGNSTTTTYSFFLNHRNACPDWFTQQEVVDLIAPIIVFGVALLVAGLFLGLFIAIQLICPRT